MTSLNISLQLILASLSKELEYFVIHSLTSFVFVHLVEEAGTCQARISDIIPLASPTTPVIAVVLALILHSRKDSQVLEYQPLEVPIAASGDVSSEQDRNQYSGASARGTDTPTNQQRDEFSGNYPTSSQKVAPSTPAISDYWEPKDISDGTLAALLNTVSGPQSFLAPTLFD